MRDVRNMAKPGNAAPTIAGDRAALDALRRPDDARPDPSGEIANRFAVSPFAVADGNASRNDSLLGLRRLITAADLSVVFQPIVYAQAPRIYAYEALLRCRRPGFQDPSELFRRAVEEGCTGRLGR